MMRVLLCSCLAFGLLHAHLFAQPPKSESLDQQAAEHDYIEALASMNVCRGKVKSGEYKLSGVIDQVKTTKADSQIEVTCKFDHAKGCLYWLRTDTPIKQGSDLGKLDGDALEKSKASSQLLIVSPNGAFLMDSENGVVRARPAARQREYEFAKVFDFKSVGLLFAAEFEKYHAFESYLHNYLKWTTKSRASDGSKKIFISELNGIETTLAIDCERDFWPVNLKVIGSKTRRNEFVRSNVELLQVQDCWVPSMYVLSDVGTCVWRLKFEWVALNQEMKESVFSLDEFRGYPGLRLLDSRSGTMTESRLELTPP